MIADKNNSRQMPAYSRVFLLDVPYHIDQPYLYYIPRDLQGQINLGSFVIVPFGGGNRHQLAVVSELLEENNDLIKNIPNIKPLYSLLYEGFALDSEFLRLCLYLREHILCTVGEAVKTVLPPAFFGKLTETYAVCAPLSSPNAHSQRCMLVYHYISSQKQASMARLKGEFGNDVAKVLSEMQKAGLIERTLEFKESGGQLYRETIRLCSEGEGADLKRSKKQSEIIAYLSENGGSEDTDELTKLFGNVRVQIKALAEKKLVEIIRTPLWRDPFRGKVTAEDDGNVLSVHQQEAFEKILALYNTGEPKAALLHGITGSGKTRIIRAMIDEVTADGRSVILLVPEISLTPQTVDYFRACYGERIAVIHSSLSAGERYDMWQRIKNGEIDICIGTRSAIFAPFDNIGMIVIDEEQEHTYKSDMSPKYHARDVARFRCAHHKALMLLSSATPSLESYYKAKNGIYTLVELNSRYGNAILPNVLIADMRRDAKEGNISSVGAVLKQELLKNELSGEQSVLFLNRRGYHNFLSCVMCGKVIMCPHCSVSLTYHSAKDKNGGQNGAYLSCHWCGYRQAVPKVCPDCQSPHLSFNGYGTQKAEEELAAMLLHSPILRMDADTTASKFAYDEILGDFRAGKANILLGTQMVTKGHDFPNVTLSAVMSADTSLYLDDYRAHERTFSMITQLLGRAGRGDAPGRAVIQTYNPDHPVIRMAAAQDYKSFYESEIAIRRALIFPPFCDIALITFTSELEADISNAMVTLDKYIKEQLHQKLYGDIQLQVFGPFEAPVYRVNDKYRMRLVIKCRLDANTRKFLRRITAESFDLFYKKITVTADINPASL